jgi:hypothetical protein
VLTVGNDAGRVERMLDEGVCPALAAGAAGGLGAWPAAGGLRTGAADTPDGAAVAVPVHGVRGDAHAAACLPVVATLARRGHPLASACVRRGARRQRSRQPLHPALAGSPQNTS